MLNKKGKTKIMLGFIVLVILSSSFYFIFQDKVRIDFQKTKTIYKVYEQDKWILAATEYSKIYEGTKLMRAKDRIINYTLDGNISKVFRYAYFKDNITLIDYYELDGNIDDIESFPKKHTITCINCEGKIVHYEIRNILYTGETKKIISPFSFGNRMKVEWQDGAYYSKVFQQKFAADKIIIKYRPLTNYETYSVRLFDPWWDNNWSKKQSITIEGGDVTLNNFTVFLNISYDADMNADFSDLRFLNSAEDTELNCELDYKLDSSYSQVWCLIPTLNTGANTIYMYYNNPVASANWKGKEAWDNNFNYVFHGEDTGTNMPNSIGNQNLTLNSLNYDTDGAFANSTNFNDVNDVSGSFSSITGSMTVIGWVKSPNPAEAEFLSNVWEWSLNPYREWLILVNTDRTLKAIISVDGSADTVSFATTGTIKNNEWSQYALKVNSTISKIIIDGSADGTTGAGTSIYNGGALLRIGSQEGTWNIFAGKHDELKIYNGELDENWIKRDYENYNLSKVVFGAGESQPYVDKFPVITLNSPEDGLNSSFSLVSLNCSATDDQLIENVSLYINDELNYTEIDGLDNVTELYQTLNFVDGNYNWTCNAYDNSSQLSWADSNFTFLVDTIFPEVDFVSPSLANGTYSQSSIWVNVSGNDTNWKDGSNLKIYLYRLTTLIQTYEDISGANSLYTNFTALSDNTYFVNASARDTSGNVKFTSTRSYILDTTLPDVNITYPENTTYNNQVTAINYTVSDTNLASCKYSLDSGITNVSITCGENVTGLSSIIGASSTWTVYSNDAAGNENSNSVTFFTLDPYNDFNITTSPNLVFDFIPDNNTHQGVAPINQSGSVGIFTAQNNLTQDISIWAKLNDTNVNITLKIGNSSTYADSVSITNVYKELFGNLTVGSQIYLWAWADYNNPQQPWYPELQIKAIFIGFLNLIGDLRW